MFSKSDRNTGSETDKNYVAIRKKSVQSIVNGVNADAAISEEQ